MKVDADRLRTLREGKGWTRPYLSQRTGPNPPPIPARTIQRLENEPERCRTTREDIVNRLASAFDVSPGVLTGELPLPESEKARSPELGRVPIGARITTKARLAYDLVRRRYGVSDTEIIGMAPLFFALLAEGSLDRRRKRLKEACEAIGHLGENGFELHPDETIAYEEESIENADVFGEQRLSGHEGLPEAFWPIRGNPFAEYLHYLDAVAVGELEVDSSRMNIDYAVCWDDLKGMVNGSQRAWKCLTTGHARIRDIPEELMDKDAGDERVRWLEERMPEDYKEEEEGLDETLGVGPMQMGADQ